MKISRRAVALGLLVLVVILAIGGGAYLYIHRRISPTSSYFAQLQAGHTNADVQKTLVLLEPFLNSVPDDFTGYGDFPLIAYKYSIAFTTYALANIAVIEPARRVEMGRAIDNMIQKMARVIVWEDWRNQGWGKDPLSKNVMWKGHLNLMLALHILTSGEGKYEGCFHRYSKSIVDELADSNFGGALCQPTNYYFQCNTVSMLSLRYHDAFYGTEYRKYQAKWLDWAKDNMVVKPTDELMTSREGKNPAMTPPKPSNLGLFYAVYHPQSDVWEKRLSGYANAWAIALLNFFDPDWAARLYHNYKSTFIHQIWRLAYSDEEPGRGMDGLATLFAVFAASEMQDQDLFDKLLNVLSLAGTEKFQSVNPEFAVVGTRLIDFPTTPAMQGPLLFGKTNIGARKLFETARPMPSGAQDHRCELDEYFRQHGVELKGHEAEVHHGK